MVVSDGVDEGATVYPCGSIRLHPDPLAAWSGVVTTKSDRTQPDWLPSLTRYQTLPDASGARWSAVACRPWVSVANRALEALADARRLTPRGSLTQTGKGRPGVAGVAAVGADFGIGRDAG